MSKRNPSSLSLSPSSLGAERGESRTTTPRMPRECAQCPPRRKLNTTPSMPRGTSGQPRSFAAEVWKSCRYDPAEEDRGWGARHYPLHAPQTGPGRDPAAAGLLGAEVWEPGGGSEVRGGPAQRHGDQARAGHEARHGRGRRGGRRLRRGPHRPR